jgi:hypothetical protein
VGRESVVNIYRASWISHFSVVWENTNHGAENIRDVICADGTGWDASFEVVGQLLPIQVEFALLHGHKLHPFGEASDAAITDGPVAFLLIELSYKLQALCGVRVHSVRVLVLRLDKGACAALVASEVYGSARVAVVEMLDSTLAETARWWARNERSAEDNGGVTGF